MKFLFYFFIALMLSLSVKGQCDSIAGVNAYGLFQPFDSVPSCWKDTVRIYMVYVDTTMTDGSRLVKVGNVYKRYTYKFPVHPEAKYKIGYGIKLKKDASEMSLINPYQGDMFWSFSFGKYLDEIGQPLPKKYLVILAIGINYQYAIPPIP